MWGVHHLWVFSHQALGLIRLAGQSGWPGLTGGTCQAKGRSQEQFSLQNIWGERSDPPHAWFAASRASPHNALHLSSYRPVPQECLSACHAVYIPISAQLPEGHSAHFLHLSTQRSYIVVVVWFRCMWYSWILRIQLFMWDTFIPNNCVYLLLSGEGRLMTYNYYSSSTLQSVLCLLSSNASCIHYLSQ